MAVSFVFLLPLPSFFPPPTKELLLDNHFVMATSKPRTVTYIVEVNFLLHHQEIDEVSGTDKRHLLN